ncbi:MAG: glycosyltransferase family A protein [Haemophilus parainfluenzae]
MNLKILLKHVIYWGKIRAKNNKIKLKIHYLVYIVPIYNVERYLEQCIESVLAQDYQNYELNFS